MKLDWIAFDADDTLWHTETFYRQAEAEFLQLLDGFGLERAEILAVFHRVEIDNLDYFGYGIRGFILSMIEAAVKVTGGAIPSERIQDMVEIGKRMTSHEIQLLPGVETTLAALKGRRLMLVTKGDALDQESKIHRSGLAGHFDRVEIVVDKTLTAYEGVLDRCGAQAESFLMVGNSLRSDIAPVLELGGWAIHVPYAMSWAHESEADLPADRSRFHEITSLTDLPAVLRRIEGS
jgi:putative hydrolase of the HAD superfamily